MPEEYHLTGVSMNVPTPANSMMLIELSVDLAPLHAENGSAQVDVLAARQFGMKARAHLDQRGDASAEANLAARRRS